MKNLVTCFLPCRAGSERVAKKNIRPFAGYEHGLIQIKLNQLLSTKLIDRIVLTSNDQNVLGYADTLGDPRVQIHVRQEDLASSVTSTDQLVGHAVELIPEGHILWTHVTSPFITSSLYDEIISTYFKKLEEHHDSLMTTTKLHSFLWQDNKPLNYDRANEKWPRTQTLKPVHEINSGVFLSSSQIYREIGDRIGQNPYLFELNKTFSFDIDWPEDFAMAECMVEKGLVDL